MKKETIGFKVTKVQRIELELKTVQEQLDDCLEDFHKLNEILDTTEAGILVLSTELLQGSIPAVLEERIKEIQTKLDERHVPKSVICKRR